MSSIKKIILILLTIALPVICFAQPQSCKVIFSGKLPTIMDFARAYCSQFDNDSFERQALVAFVKGNAKRGKTECIVDTKNGYVKYTTTEGDALYTLEMCYWNCDNKNEKLVAVNTINTSMGFNESFLSFYRYNVKTKTMRIIDAPFNRSPAPIDLVNQSIADKKTIDMVLNSQNEDSNKYQPCYELPRTGKDITYRMADTNAIPKQFQRESKLKWDSSRFYIED